MARARKIAVASPRSARYEASARASSTASTDSNSIRRHRMLAFPTRERGRANVRRVAITVNGVRHEAEVEPRQLLVYFLREQLGLTGTNVGCDTSSCGACTVLLDGESVKSCTVLAVQADGTEITTIEGLAGDGELHPV